MAGGFFAQALMGASDGIQGYERQKVADQQYQSNEQTIAMNKMAMAMQQKHQKAQEDIGAYMGAQMDKDKSIITDPSKMAQLQMESATQAFKAGDFVLGKEMAAEAKQSYAEAKQKIVALSMEKAEAKKELSTEAYEFGAGDMSSTDAQQSLVKKAIDAGVNPLTIPKPTDTVKFQAWAQKMENDASTAEQRSTFIQKQHTEELSAEDRKTKIRDAEQAQADRVADKAADRDTRLMIAELAHSQKDRAAAKPQFQEMGDFKYQYDPDHRYKGARMDDEEDTPGNDWVQVGLRKLTAKEHTGVSRAIPSAQEVARNLENMDKFVGTSLSPFHALPGDTIVSSLERLGTNELTKDQMVAYGSTVTGLGVELGNLMTSMGGYSPGEHTQQELQRMASREAGTSGIVAAYKIANTADIVKTYVKALPQAESNPEIQKILKKLDKYPEPSTILAKIQSKEDLKKVRQFDKSASVVRSEAVKSAVAGPDTPSGSGGLPPGVTQTK